MQLLKSARIIKRPRLRVFKLMANLISQLDGIQSKLGLLSQLLQVKWNYGQALVSNFMLPTRSLVRPRTPLETAV